MKLNKYFMGFLGALAMTACSSEEPAVTGGVDDDATFSDNYLAISIQMPNGMGRATDEYDGNYTDGTVAESHVDNVVFFFFDVHDNCVDIQKIDNPTFEKDVLNQNPYVTSFGIQEIRLKSGLDYSKVAVVLNSSVDNASAYRAEIKTLADLEARSQDYVKGLGDDGSMQVMSNSVYYNTANAEIEPKREQKIILVPITEENIYTSAERAAAGIGNLPKGKHYVDIYVERVLARVDVKAEINVKKDYYVAKADDGTKVNTITIYDNVDLTTREVTIEPVILGMTLNVLTKEAKLIKPISTSQVGYGIGAGAGYKDFRWNDPANKRSYWANTTTYDKSDMTYYSWDETKKKGMGDISMYIHPNTQDFEPTEANENSSLNTKVMVVAQLKAKDVETEELSDISLVRYGSEYMEESGLLAHVANTVNIAVRSINWTGLEKKLLPAEAEIISVAVNNAFVDGTTFDMYELGILSGSSDSKDSSVDYEAKISQSDKFKYDIVVDKTLWDDVADANIHAILADDAKVADLIATAKEIVNKTVADVMNDVNVPRILYWKDGMTYYYVNIRQQGFYGLTGKTGNGDYLNGVVRNHIYQVNLQGIYGLGTPVIDPGLPIDPERPTIERPSYIQARINVLPWRVVENNATIH